MFSVQLNRVAGDVMVITAWFGKTFRIFRTSEEQKQAALIDGYITSDETLKEVYSFVVSDWKTDGNILLYCDLPSLKVQ